MTPGKSLEGKSYAGNPHVQSDEGEVAPAATSRRVSLLCKSDKMKGSLFLCASAGVVLWWGASAAATAPSTVAEPPVRRLSVEDYRDKMKAGWLGQMIGVEWGLSTEFRYQGRTIPDAEVPAWKPEMINGSFANDDLYVEMTFLRTLEQYGLDVSPQQAGMDYANTTYGLCAANWAGRDNLRRGIAPPDCGHPRYNACADNIDYQIESDYAGLISPGLP